MSNNLLPCPFCGGETELDAGETLDDHVVKLTYYVFCYGCFVQSAKFPSEAEAIAAWNRRADYDGDYTAVDLDETQGFTLQEKPEDE